MTKPYNVTINRIKEHGATMKLALNNNNNNVDRYFN